MEKENFFQKLFGSFAIGSNRVPLRSNIYGGGKGYSPIGTNSPFGGNNMDRKSPLLGTASASNLLSGYYERISELKGYQLLDISKLATNFFADYITNFLSLNGQQLITIMQEDGSDVDSNKTERINNILTNDIKILDFIRDHVQDYVFYGQYYGMLQDYRDETGHTRYRVEELYDPVSVVSKKVKDSDGKTKEVFLARGDDNGVYEIPSEEIIYIGNLNLRLRNDLDEKFSKDKGAPRLNNSKDKKTNREKVMNKESYSVGEPLLYTLLLKVKELVIKELLVSLISLRDLSSVQIFLLQFDKNIPIETANDLCARATKLCNNTNELASFLSANFDATKFIENTLTQSAKFIPDYNSSIASKNGMVPLDKLSDKLLEIMQSLDQCRAAVLSPLGLPTTLTDSTSGSKWAVLQQSERANSRVASFMDGIKDSVINLVSNIYKKVYNEDLDTSLIKLHITEKTSVEYNNQINQSESITGLVGGITNLLQNSLQSLEGAMPLIDPAAFVNYIRGLIKDIDPNTENLITDETVEKYVQVAIAKNNAQLEQMGIQMDG
jgi:hypothetical protein